MKLKMQKSVSTITGDQLLGLLTALDNPHRLRILALLHTEGRNYISQLARDLGISRPLLHLHLQKLEEAGLVRSERELSADGKALNYFTVTNFSLQLDPQTIADASHSLSASTKPD